MAIDYLQRIEQAEKKLKPWRENAKRIVQKYRGVEGEMRDEMDKPVINLHWANQQLYMATVFARAPKPEVTRKFKDNADPTAQDLSEIMQATLEYAVDAYDFEDQMESVLVDYGNTALGITRVKYIPYFQTQKDELGNTVKERIPVTVSDDISSEGLIVSKYYDPEFEVVENPLQDDQGYYIEGDEIEDVVYEEVCMEFMPWDKFVWDTDRPIWRKVTWTAFEHTMTEQECVKEFGKRKAALLKYDVSEDDKKALIGKYAKVYEVFDKTRRKVIFCSPGYNGGEGNISETDDPYKLQDFFPHPKPLFGTMTSNKLIPVPLYQILQDLFTELNEVQRRIMHLTQMLKVRGAYNSALQDTFQNILSMDDGHLEPINQWTEQMEKGGMTGMMSFLSLTEINAALQTLQANRVGIIQQINDISGYTDAARGSTRTAESAAASKIKNQYLSTRINREVKKVSRFVRDNLRLMAEMIGEHFQADTVRQITGKDFTDEEFAELRSDLSRAYKIDVETDSMLQEDEEVEAEERSKVTNSIATLIQAFAPIAQTQPFMGEGIKQIILWTVRGTKRGRELEKQLQGLSFAPPPMPPAVPGAEIGAEPGADGSAPAFPQQ